MNRFYFAYGSNLLYARLAQRLGYIKHCGTFTLKGWKLVFNCGGGFANVEQTNDPKDIVEGVLYELSKRQERELDEYEGFYYKVDIKTPKGTIFLYKAYPKAITTLRPSLFYLNYLLDGCLENNLVTTYNKLVDLKNSLFTLKASRHKKFQYDN